MPAACWRRGWTLPRCLTGLQKHFPTRLSTLKPSCSRVQLYRPTTFWPAPASSTNTPASCSLFHLAPSTWSTGSSISPRTRWRCPGEHMAWLLKLIFILNVLSLVKSYTTSAALVSIESSSVWDWVASGGEFADCNKLNTPRLIVLCCGCRAHGPSVFVLCTAETWRTLWKRTCSLCRY